jgi:hypothetical protein
MSYVQHQGVEKKASVWGREEEVVPVRPQAKVTRGKRPELVEV